MTLAARPHLGEPVKQKRRLAGPAALAAVLCCVGATAAIAAPPRPVDLRVIGGESWHSDNSFSLEWRVPTTDDDSRPAWSHFRIRDPLGTPVAEDFAGWDGEAGVTTPRLPGVYSVELWLENAGGAGPAAIAQLRFDDARPAAIAAATVPAWIGRTSFPLRVRLGHPAGLPPLSGLRGYAVAIDAAAGGAPCAEPDRCTDAETTLRGGVADDELEIRALPEGISHLHAVAVSGAGMRSPTASHTVLRVDTTDPVTQLAGEPSGWVNRTVRLTASATDDRSGMDPGGPGGTGPSPFTAIRVDRGAPTIAPGGSVSTDLVDEGLHRVAYYARDAAGNTDDGAEVNGFTDRAPRTAWVRIDRTPPSLGFTNSQDPADPELLRVGIADQLSRPDLSRGRIGVRKAGSGDRFESLPPAPPRDGELRARWDSDSSPQGEYEFQAIGYDIAGNASTTARRRNGGPMVLSNPLKTATDLRAAFRRHGTERTVPYGRTVLIAGRLTSGPSTPLADAPVRMAERFATGARPAARVSTARTAADGAFSIRVGDGPSRTIAIGFDGSRTLTGSSGRMLHLRVRSGVRLRLSSALARVGGAPLVFRGEVLAEEGGIPAEGKSVQLQFRLPGQPWAEFRTLQTDRRGRFRYAYRFSDDDSRGARFQFRAFAPAQKDWPYEPGGSRPVLVRGR